MADTQTQIIDYIVNAMRVNMPFTAAQCYKSMKADYLEGQNPQVLQICPGAIAPADDGEGLQFDGCLKQRMTVNMAYWLRLETDQPFHTQNRLSDATQGMLPIIEQVKALMRQTKLGGLLCEVAFFLQETEATWVDEAAGICYKTISYSVCWAEGAIFGETV